MAKKTTSTFAITIRGQPGAYTVEADGPHDIRVDSEPFTWSPTPEQTAALTALVSKTGRVTSDTIRDLGRALYGAVFIPPIATAWGRAQASAEGEGGLRLRLHIEARELGSLPWEVMHDGQGFLSARSDSPLVRGLPGPDGIEQVKRLQVRGALRILFVGVSPQGLPALEIDQTAAQLRQLLAKAIKKKRIVFDVLLDATLEELRSHLLRNYHIIYFAGHGTPEGIYLDDGEGGERDPLSGKRPAGDPYRVTARTLASELEGKPTRLVFLAACETGALPDEGRGLLAGFAQELARRARLPAIVAMQYSITDIQASQLTARFFESLAVFYPVDVALAEARKSLIRRGRVGRDVIAPVMYLQARDGALFRPAWNWTATAIALAVALMFAIAIGLVLFSQAQENREQARAEATARVMAEITGQVEATRRVAAQKTAQMEATQRAFAQATAQAEAAAKVQAQAEAEAEAEARATQQAIAEEEAAIALSRELAAQVDVALRDGDVLSAYQLALRAYKTWPTLESERVLYSVTAKPLPEMILRGHTDRATSASFSPDGMRIATTSFDTTVILWDADSGVPVETLHCPGSWIVNAIEFNSDGSRLVSAGGGETCLWDALTGEQLLLLRSDAGYVSAASINPAGTQIVTAHSSPLFAPTAQIFDVGTRGKLAVLTGHADGIESVRFSPDGTRIVTASRDGTARVWDAANGTEMAVLEGHTSGVNSAVFSPDGMYIVTAGIDRTARLWDASTGEELHIFRGHAATLTWASFSPNGKLVATTSGDGTARVWDVESGKQLAVLWGHVRGVNSVAFSPDGVRIVTVGDDGAAWVWNLDSIGGPVTLTGHTEWVNSASFDSDGTRIVTASGAGADYELDSDFTVRVWDAESGRQLQVLEGHTQVVLAASFSPDGSRIVSAGGERDWDCEESICDFRVRVWDAESGAQLEVFEGHTASVHDVRFSPDGKRIVTASEDASAVIWDIETGEQLTIITGTFSLLWFRSASFSPDGKRIVTTSSTAINSGDSITSTVDVWDAETGEKLVTIKGHTARVNDASFSPDGTRIVTASDDSTAIVWDAETGGQLLILEGHADVVNTATLNPDGRRIVTASTDGTARLWDAESGKQLHVVEGDLVANFSPDGTRLVTAGYDHNARVWMVDIDKVLHIAEEGVARLGIAE